MAQAAFNQKAANLWVSRVIPAILIGLVGYVSYVVIVRLSVHYLLDPPSNLHTANRGAAIAICLLYAILVLLMGLTYFRLLYTVTTNPGYVPQGSTLRSRHRRSKSRRRHRYRKGNIVGDEKQEKAGNPLSEKREGRGEADGGNTDGAFYAPGSTEPTPGLQDFYSKEVFVCQGDGRPIWCSSCENWKPDRAHHCREIGRCVRKMDHFCPWVGGVVSETSFKFFIQFVFWAAVYCVFTLIIMAYFIAEFRRKTNSYDVHWLVTLCLAGLFGLFTLGMAGSSLQFVLLNSTTIENLSRKNVVWTLAIHMPKEPEQAPPYRTISYASPQRHSDGRTHTNQDQPPAIRTFAILHTKPGENPFDLGPSRNFKSVMGNHWYDWFLPLKYSPCCDHDRDEGHFAMGPVVQIMRREAGIAPPGHADDGMVTRRRRRRRRRRSTGLESDGSRHVRSDKRHAAKKHNPPGTGHDRDEIDLESRLGDRNSSLH